MLIIMLAIMLIIMLIYAYYYAFMLILCFYAIMLAACYYAFFYARIIGTSQSTSAPTFRSTCHVLGHNTATAVRTRAVTDCRSDPE